jgi:hypothetical protein
MIKPPDKRQSLTEFNETPGIDELSALEKLRFFCSIAMSNQDWLDVEQFFSAIETSPPPSKELSDDEIEKLSEQHLIATAQFIGAGEVWIDGYIEFARAIEKAHGIE